MNTILVAYELDPLAIVLQHKQRIEAYLQSTINYAKLSENVWIVKTTAESTRIRDDFRSILLVGNPSPQSKIMAIDLNTNKWASFNFSEDVNGWMKSNL